MSDIKIEKGVPIPIGYSSRSDSITALLRSMEVGDSFFKVSDSPARLQVAITSCKRHVGEGKVFVTRTREENGVKGIRVWRTA